MFQVALRDGLTGAYNRRYLDERLGAEFAFAKRHATPLSLMLIDLDHFKQINDQHGHQAGDTVLKAFFQLLAAEVRAEDVVGRYGGEEFIVMCRQTVGAGAITLAERLRARVEKAELTHDGTPIELTISIGIAGMNDEIEQAEHLVKAADKALYRAKGDGRNCWRVARPT
jgi:diguanylate cyclase (GGDEF)-like protein